MSALPIASALPVSQAEHLSFTDLDDDSIFNIVAFMDDRTVCDFSLASRRLQHVAATSSRHRRLTALYSTISFPPVLHTTTDHPWQDNGRSQMVHPLEAINVLEQNPSICKYVREIKFAVGYTSLPAGSPLRTNQHSFGDSTLDRLRLISNLDRYIEEFKFLDPAYDCDWASDAYFLCPDVSLVILLCMCPSVSVLTLSGQNGCSDELHAVEAFMLSLSRLTKSLLDSKAQSAFQNTSQGLPLTIPQLHTIHLNLPDHLRRPFSFMAQYPGLKTIKAENVSDIHVDGLHEVMCSEGHVSPTTVRTLDLIDSRILRPDTFVRCFQALTNLQVLRYTCRDDRWPHVHGNAPLNIRYKGIDAMIKSLYREIGHFLTHRGLRIWTDNSTVIQISAEPPADIHVQMREELEGLAELWSVVEA